MLVLLWICTDRSGSDFPGLVWAIPYTETGTEECDNSDVRLAYILVPEIRKKFSVLNRKIKLESIF